MSIVDTSNPLGQLSSGDSSWQRNCWQPTTIAYCGGTYVAPTKPSPESAAADIVRALKPLSVEDRERVMRAVHILLETSSK